VLDGIDQTQRSNETLDLMPVSSQPRGHGVIVTSSTSSLLPAAAATAV